MGMRIDVRCPGDLPLFDQLAAALKDQIGTLSVRMIDNLPAFPDEIPEPGWNELRLATANGMISLRRTPDGVSCIVWGNASPALVGDQRAIAGAIALLANGNVVHSDPPA